MTALAPKPDRAAASAARSQFTDNSAQLLYARLKGTNWTIRSQDEALAMCFCMMVLKLDPLVHPRTIASVLQGAPDQVFDETAFINAMASLGFRYLRLKAKLSDLDERLLPALVCTPDHGAQVFYNETGQAHLFDGHEGAHVPLETSDGRADVLVFSRIVESDMATSKTARESTGWTWFAAVLRRFRPQMRFMLVLGVGLNLMSLLVPVLILVVHSQVISSGDLNPLYYLCFGAALIVGIELLLRRLRSRFAVWMMARLDYIVGCASFEKLLGLPANALTSAGISSQLARIKTFEAVRDFLCGPLMISAMELPMSLMALVFLTLLGHTIVLPALFVMGMFVLLILASRRRAGIQIRRAALESSRMQQFTLETFAKFEAIRLDGLSEKWQDRYRALSGREQMALMRLALVGSRSEILAHFLVGISTVLTLFFGAKLIWAGQMGAGALIACVMLQIRALSPLHALVGMVPRLEQLRNSVIQINQLMDMEDEETAQPRSMASSRLGGHIQFSNIALRYDPKAPLIFSGFSLEIAAGEVIGITGPSGSGKSSLLKMPLALVTPQLGGVRIGSFDIRQLNPVDLREQIAYVPQYVDLFSGTIAANMRLGMPIARDTEIESALVEVGAWEAISQFPDGIYTVIDPTVLGETMPLLRERLGLARALLRDTKILLIDERPTAMLLAGFDEDIRRCLTRYRTEKTILFVSYRTDFLRMADRVVALQENGRAQIGTLDKIVRMV
ncbi:Toxin RTX-I translocation ATP-binding protein [Aquimixticola soesokkakensis]|uniref:Toxin RTX-I translocation ATP-binding protein n=1 Tax=Aquimixticola soesokkakensis TaxID=1519096 RepID=A0A1Y5TQB8_9RHOB|nr:ATP-binding cassette domain-containing protein [Aquimixticola soesokkakensis]SLN69382.1 Toxin RTX-I translocation ATP-binding protein [Aquimixticola soesokkakensis]